MDTQNNKPMILADAIVGEVIETIHSKSEGEKGTEKEKLLFYAQAFQFAFQLLARKLLVIYNRETIQQFLDQAMTTDPAAPNNKSNSSH